MSTSKTFTIEEAKYEGSAHPEFLGVTFIYDPPLRVQFSKEHGENTWVSHDPLLGMLLVEEVAQVTPALAQAEVAATTAFTWEHYVQAESSGLSQGARSLADVLKKRVTLKRADPST